MRIRVKDAMKELGFKSVGSLAHALFKKYPARRQGIKVSTYLLETEVQYLRNYKVR
jgi:hypothetical protein